MFTKNLIAVSVVIGLLSACQSTPKNQGSKEFDISKQLMSSNKYAEAVAYLEQAANKNPNNQQYAQMLADARRKAVAQLTGKIESLLTTQTLNKANLDKANALLTRAKAILPTHSSYENSAALILEKQTNLETKVKGLYSNVKINIARNDWVKAKFTIKKLIKLFPNYEDSAQIKQKIKISGSRFYLNQAYDANKNNDFFKTLEFARKAVTVNPTNLKAKQLISTTNEKNNKEYFISLAQKAVQQNDWSAVYNNCKSALFYDAKNAFCLEQLKTAKTKRTESLVSKTRQLLTQGYLAKSINSYKEAVSINDGMKNNALAALKTKLATKTAQTAQELSIRGKFGSGTMLQPYR